MANSWKVQILIMPLSSCVPLPSSCRGRSACSSEMWKWRRIRKPLRKKRRIWCGKLGGGRKIEYRTEGIRTSHPTRCHRAMSKHRSKYEATRKNHDQLAVLGIFPSIYPLQNGTANRSAGRSFQAQLLEGLRSFSRNALFRIDRWSNGRELVRRSHG